MGCKAPAGSIGLLWAKRGENFKILLCAKRGENFGAEKAEMAET